jgi:F0F1-type ATP synthase membrane subunit c/vacuolar-type H+-ATPase subunit K
MTVVEPAGATKRPVMLWGIRASLWAVGCVLAGAVIGAQFDLAIPGVAVGLVAGSAMTAVLERKDMKSLRLQLIATTLMAAWIIGLTLFTRS